ncbi:MAG: hypothetical protein M0026_12315 [Nocardiopsaceae bacterium]|nr:hypothetical protein [Nocardiopsaceae bacterium]
MNLSVKTRASVRTILLPVLILDDLRRHLDRFAHPGEEGLCSSASAELVYLHARDERSRELVDTMGERAARELRKARGGSTGGGRGEPGNPADDPADSDPLGEASGTCVARGGRKGSHD